MKKLIFILMFLPLFTIGQNTIPGTVVENDTIMSDTIYWFNTSDCYFWTCQVNYSGVTAQDTVVASIVVSNDDGTTYSDYTNMASQSLTSTYDHQAFRDWWNEGKKLGIKIDVGVVDTVYIDKVFYLLRKKAK